MIFFVNYNMLDFDICTCDHNNVFRDTEAVRMSILPVKL